jgi:hypothetical protein
MRRIFHRHGRFLLQALVVVDKIDCIGITIRKTENNPLVGPHRHGPEAFHIALERVQMKTGHTHVLNSLGFAELGKDGTYLVDQVGSNPFRIVPFEEPFQALVPKADYHTAL